MRCNIEAEAAGEIWHWSLSGVKGLTPWRWCSLSKECGTLGHTKCNQSTVTAHASQLTRVLFFHFVKLQEGGLIKENSVVSKTCACAHCGVIMNNMFSWLKILYAILISPPINSIVMTTVTTHCLTCNVIIDAQARMHIRHVYQKRKTILLAVGEMPSHWISFNLAVKTAASNVSLCNSVPKWPIILLFPIQAQVNTPRTSHAS